LRAARSRFLASPADCDQALRHKFRRRRLRRARRQPPGLCYASIALTSSSTGAG